MKKILLINSSNRKKNTYNLLVSIEKLLIEEGFSTEIISLKDYKLDFCRGCEVCVMKGGCFVKDDADIIMNKIIECDGLVIGTPVYLNNMTGILKTFIDRTCSWFHRSPVAQKPTLLLANTQGSGIKSTLSSIEESLVQWGVALCGSVSRNGKSFATPISKNEINNFITLVNANGVGYKPSFKEISTYNVQRALATNVFPFDKEYWDKQDWLTSSYYPNTKVSFIKKSYGNMLYKILCKNIKPHKN
ncbi:MAG: flavodoxin family protein [Peptostreptococcaceae bacterium]